MKKILLFDTIIDGHHPDYLSHLIRYWLNTQPTGELIVVAQAAFEPTFEELTAHNPLGASVRFDAISPQDIEQTHRATGLNRSFKEWKLVLKYSQAYQPTHLLLLYFDVLQFGFWLGQKASCPVSGIYFRPDFHYSRAAGPKEWVRMFRKKTTLRGVLTQQRLTNLFCLDHSAVPLVQAMNPRVRVVPLPDPVKRYDVSVVETDSLRQALRIEPDRTIFLLFGYLDERKGLEPLLDAITLINPTLHHKFCFLLVGPATADFQRVINQKMAAVPSGIQVIPVFREIKGAAIQGYFNLADVVLTLYQQHIGMASVLVRAALSGKPVISSNYGYMGQLVQQEQLGITTDSTAPAAIAHALQQAVTEGVPHSVENLPIFADKHTDETFASVIFNQL